MFEFLRRLIVPIIIIVLIFFVGLIVLEWGLDFTGRQQMGLDAQYAGSINGQKISWDSYNRLFQGLYQAESQQSDQDLPDSRVRELERNAWNQIVHNELLAQEAAKHNIIVTDEELYAFLRMSPPQELQQAPAFQTDGRFDYQKYLSAMADQQWAGFWAQIEPSIRADIERMKMQELVVQTIQVSEEEIKQAFLDANEKVRIGLVNVPYARFASNPPTVTDDELKSYYESNKDKYKLEERAVLNIVLVEKKPTEDDWSRIGSRMRIIYDSAKAGADFATLAMNYSADGSAAQGGDLGWFGQGQMVPEFDQRSFSMQEGQISEPFRTQFGWHIIMHQGYRDTVLQAGSQPVRQAHVSHILLRVEQSQESLDALFAQLRDFQEQAKDGGFQEAAAGSGYQVRTTAPFTRRGNIQYIGYDVDVDSFAFTNEVGAVTDVRENNSAFYVAELAQRLPAGEPSFDEIKAQLTQDLRKEKFAAQARDLANRAYQAAKSGQSLQTAAQSFGLNYEESDYLTRSGYHPQLGRDPKALGAAFSMTTPGQIIGPVDHATGSAIMTLLERQVPDLTQFSEKRDSIFTAVRGQKQQEFYGRWFENLMQRADIENNISRMNRAGL